MRSIRPARPDEAEALSSLAIESKSHWQYAAEQMAVFRGELTLTPEQVVDHCAHVLEEDGRVVGFYTILGLGAERPELAHIFVDPAYLSRGIGRALFRHACATAAAAGSKLLVIQSDPNAAGFYRALGAAFVDEIPSSIPGRRIPCFIYSLSRES